MIARRALLANAAGCATAALLPAPVLGQPGEDDWAPARAILARIVRPRFPRRDFDIRRFGADNGSLVRTTTAVREAIAACAAAGGGRVVVPAGTWPTGAIRLLSGVELHLAEGAVLRFSTDPADYLPMVLTRFEGVECMNFAPLIYALDASDVAISGKGKLDGQADWSNWWNWISRNDETIVAGRKAAQTRLAEMAAKDVPVEQRTMGIGGYLRPSFIQTYRCRNVLIDGPTIVGAPMWVIHPVLCNNVTVRNVVVHSLGPNNDGCDPESCRDVLIEGCDFTTGDDCIAIKSGRNRDGRRVGVPSEDIVVRNCRMRDGHGGVSLGSEASGGIRNIYVRDCQMGGPDLLRALRLKSNSHRGGYIENVMFRDVMVDSVKEGVLEISLLYGEGPGGAHPPRRVGNVTMRNVRSGASLYGVDIQGDAALRVEAVTLVDCRFDGVRKGNRIEKAEVYARDVTVNGVSWEGRSSA